MIRPSNASFAPCQLPPAGCARARIRRCFVTCVSFASVAEGVPFTRRALGNCGLCPHPHPKVLCFMCFFCVRGRGCSLRAEGARELITQAIFRRQQNKRGTDFSVPLKFASSEAASAATAAGSAAAETAAGSTIVIAAVGSSVVVAA